VAPRCNARGQTYGFVRFLKVRDVDKMVQALTNVWFGDLRVWAKVARFKFGELEVGKRDVVYGGRGSKIGTRDNSKEVGKKVMGEPVIKGVVGGGVVVVGEHEGVRVGQVVVRLDGKVQIGNKGRLGTGMAEKKTVEEVCVCWWETEVGNKHGNGEVSNDSQV
jgi:hypothetical protein